MLRYKNQSQFLQKHRSIQCLERINDQEKPYCLKKINRTKNRGNTKSLQSIEFNRASVIVPLKPHSSNRRKLVSMQKCESKLLFTDRAQKTQQATKKIVFENYSKRVNKHDRMQTFDEPGLDFKEKKIKDCIQLMQGVLQELKIQKSQHCRMKQKNPLRCGPDEPSEEKVAQKISKQGQLSKFQSYVHKVCKYKQDNKLIILRKAKTKSILNKETIKSTIILNADKFQTIRQEKPRPIEPINPSAYPAYPLNSRKRKQKQYFIDRDEVQDKRFDQIQYSSIDPANESSFISESGKLSLMKHLEHDQNFTKEKSITENPSKPFQKLKNNRKLKSLFPEGFF